MAQAIPVLASPLLTRLYTPVDFGLLAVFVALVSSIAPAVCGRYELAMVLPSDRVHVIDLLGISLQFALLVAMGFLLIAVCTIKAFTAIRHTPIRLKELMSKRSYY